MFPSSKRSDHSLGPPTQNQKDYASGPPKVRLIAGPPTGASKRFCVGSAYRSSQRKIKMILRLLL